MALRLWRAARLIFLFGVRFILGCGSVASALFAILSLVLLVVQLLR